MKMEDKYAINLWKNHNLHSMRNYIEVRFHFLLNVTLSHCEAIILQVKCIIPCNLK